MFFALEVASEDCFSFILSDSEESTLHKYRCFANAQHNKKPQKCSFDTTSNNRLQINNIV
jgi:hypothetical protein